MSIFKADAMRSFLFAILAIALLFALFLKKVKGEVVVGFLAVLVLVDLWGIDRRYMDNEKQGREYVHWRKEVDKMYPHNANPADLAILQTEMQLNPELPKKCRRRFK